jgi:hypothetical protein
MILIFSEMKLSHWIGLLVTFSNVSLQIVLAWKAFRGIRTIPKGAPERNRRIQRWVTTGLMSEQVLPQTKGFLQAVDDCTGELLVMCPPMVPVEHVLFFEFLIA